MRISDWSSYVCSSDLAKIGAEIICADEQHVDTLDSGDLLSPVKRVARLDHDDDHGGGIHRRVSDIGRMAAELEVWQQPGCRACAERWVLGATHDLARIFCRSHMRCDDP